MLSIITPVFNGALFIEQTIQSIMKLKINFEHIIVDGGSSDGTLDVIKKYDHIKLIHQKDKDGMYRAIDLGFLSATGTYVTWVNSDDKIIADNYELLYKQALDQQAALAYSDSIYNFIDEYRYEFVPALPFSKYFLRRGIMPFVQPSSIFLKSLYNEAGGLNYNRFKIIGDRDMFQRFSFMEDKKFIYVPTITTIFLRYNESLLYSNLEKVKEERKYTIKTDNSISNRLFLHVTRFIMKIYRSVNK